MQFGKIFKQSVNFEKQVQSNETCNDELTTNDLSYLEDKLDKLPFTQKNQDKECKLCGLIVERDYPYGGDDSCTKFDREHVWKPYVKR